MCVNYYYWSEKSKMLNLNCVICAELFTQSDDVHVTTCGHMFHFTCLKQWMERYILGTRKPQQLFNFDNLAAILKSSQIFLNPCWSQFSLRNHYTYTIQQFVVFEHLILNWTIRLYILHDTVVQGITTLCIYL